MDMGFPPKGRTRHGAADTPDLQVLLAEASARQATSCTAVVQSRLHRTIAVSARGNPLINIFDPDGRVVASPHRFGALSFIPVNPRQPT